jgi:hypothetical protein
MKKIMVMVLAGFTLCGCSSVGGNIPHGNTTQTVLDKGNYTMLCPAAKGESSGFALFGIIPFASPTHSKAMSDLYKNIDVKGKSSSLVNVSQEYSSSYFILFSIPKITITADVIEFNKQ